MAKEDSHSVTRLFTPEDLAIFKDIRPKLSPGGCRLVDLILKVFDSENSPTDITGLMQNLSSSSGTEPVDLLYTLYTLMNGAYKPK